MKKMNIMKIMKNRNKKSIILATTVIFLILFVTSINSVSATEYWGYDTGKRAHAYNSSKDEQVIGFQTRVLFSRENSGDNWKLAEIKLGLETSLKDDGIDGSYNYIFVGGNWRYYIDEIKFEVKIARYDFDPAEKRWIITPLSGSVLSTMGKGVSEGSGGSYDPWMSGLYNWIVCQIIGTVPYFGTIGSAAFSFITIGSPPGDSFSSGSTSNSHWCKFKEGYMQQQETLGIRVYMDATQNIYKSTHPWSHHEITIKYTVVTKSIGYYWAYPNSHWVSECYEWTTTNQVTIQI